MTLYILDLLLFAISSILLLLRGKMYEVYIFSEEGTRKDKIAHYYYKDLLSILLTTNIFGTLFLPFCVVGIYDNIFEKDFLQKNVTSLFILGITLIVFFYIQVPTMRKPSIYVTALKSLGGEFERRPHPTLCLRSGAEELILFDISNLGINFYKNCCVWFSFPKDFELIGYNEKTYGQIDFKKGFVIQKRNTAAIFSPDKNYQSIAPTNELAFPIKVKTPREKTENKEVMISVQCENRFGEAKKLIKINLA